MAIERYLISGNNDDNNDDDDDMWILESFCFDFEWKGCEPYIVNYTWIIFDILETSAFENFALLGLWSTQWYL